MRTFLVVCLIAVALAQLATAESLTERISAKVQDTGSRKMTYLANLLLHPESDLFTSFKQRRVTKENGVTERYIIDERGSIGGRRVRVRDGEEETSQTIASVVQRLRDADQRKGGVTAAVYKIEPSVVTDGFGIQHETYQVSQMDQSIADTDERSALHKTIDRIRDANGKGGVTLRVDETTVKRGGRDFQRFVVDPVESKVSNKDSVMAKLSARLRDSDNSKGGGFGAFAVAAGPTENDVIVEDVLALRQNVMTRMYNRIRDSDYMKGGTTASFVKVVPVASAPEKSEFLVQEL